MYHIHINSICVFCFQFIATSSNLNFPTWENEYFTLIQDGGDVFEERSSQNEEVQPEINLQHVKIIDQIEILKTLKEYAIQNDLQSLYLNVQRTIQDLQWHVSSGKTYAQRQITQYFSHL